MSIRPVLLVLMVCFTACASTRLDAQDARPSADLAEFIRLYDTDQSGVSRFYDLPWSEFRFDRMERVVKDWQGKHADIDFAALDQQGKIDHILLRNKLTLELRRLDLDRRRLAEMNDLLPFRPVIQDLQRTMWGMKAVDPEKAATSLAALPDQIKKLRERLEKGKKDPKKDDGADVKKEEAKEPDATGVGKPEVKPDAEPLRVSPTVARRTAAAVGEVRWG